MPGKIILFTAPSGAGKTTIVKHLLNTNPRLEFSISACTRDKRGRSEVNGKDYYFITPEEFRQKIEQDAFVEWEEVYEGAFYGTLKSEIERIWSHGKTAILDVDVKGGLKIKEFYGDRALAIFVKPPSLEILGQRLQARQTDSASSISSRIFKAKFEMSFENKFDAVIVNENLEDAFQQAENLVNKFIGSPKVKV
ncbi:guanylate kinase [Adhaeribacter aerolatus]|uniref:Guanylate kinase n=1 Tax=Adhaeribacter aerolatus TaxID=670289 RepID=A0A512AS08_9BACT|nr:guanylate kinase [Adhaeribacter aerolatus]GEO02501.1 guanylate kinase [Adhaeribacter aerolatus]